MQVVILVTPQRCFEIDRAPAPITRYVDARDVVTPAGDTDSFGVIVGGQAQRVMRRVGPPTGDVINDLAVWGRGDDDALLGPAGECLLGERIERPEKFLGVGRILVTQRYVLRPVVGAAHERDQVGGLGNRVDARVLAHRGSAAAVAADLGAPAAVVAVQQAQRTHYIALPRCARSDRVAERGPGLAGPWRHVRAG